MTKKKSEEVDGDRDPRLATGAAGDPDRPELRVPGDEGHVVIGQTQLVGGETEEESGK